MLSSTPMQAVMDYTKNDKGWMKIVCTKVTCMNENMIT